MKTFLLSTRIIGALICASAIPVVAAPTPPSKNGVAPNFAPSALPAATQAKLRALLSNPKVADGHIGICIQALGKVSNAQAFPSRPYASNAKPIIFTQNANSRFMPASNLKLYTAALALHKLGSEYSFGTHVDLLGDHSRRPEIIAADLILHGAGDPSLSTADIEKLADQIVARGVKFMTRDVYGVGGGIRAETFGGRYPDGWTLDDTLWYYGPEVSGLAVNRNQVDVYITGGAKAGDPATLRVEPALPAELGFEIKNSVVTGAANEETNIVFDRGHADVPISRVLDISGKIAPGKTYTDGVAVPNPPQWAALILKSALEKRGVKFNYPITPEEMTVPPLGSPFMNKIAEHKSPPLRVLLQKFLKTSDNLYGEMLLRACGTPSAPLQAKEAHDELRKWLRQNKIDDAPLRFEDGSGLSRYNIITPRATTGLLAAVEKMKGGDAFWNALPIAGVDGTLKNRMKNTPAQNNARAKTGTFSIVSTLSGYVTTRDGHRLAVSLLTNFVRNGNDARELQNQVYATLANTAWQMAAPKPQPKP